MVKVVMKVVVVVVVVVAGMVVVVVRVTIKFFLGLLYLSVFLVGVTVVLMVVVGL